MKTADYEAAVAHAEHESRQAYAAFRRALRALTDAELQVLSARLDLADHLAEISHTTRKARR